MIKNIIVIVSFLYSPMILSENNTSDWMLVKDDNDIKVYTQKSDYSNIVKAKARAIIHAPLNNIKNILDDIDRRHEWIPFLTVSKALTKYDNNSRIEYSHFYAPWPATDRDFVYEMRLVSTKNNIWVYKMKSVKTKLMAVEKDKIRAELFETIYTLTALNDKTTQVELVYHADPRGWIPTWIINIIQKMLPYKIMSNLKDRLKA